jgi:hypothetical protein
LNKQVKIDKRTIFYPEWFNRGVKFVTFEPLELRKIFCRDDGTKGVCKLDDLSPHGYNFSICRKELITPLYCKKFTQSPNLFEN